MVGTVAYIAMIFLHPLLIGVPVVALRKGRRRAFLLIPLLLLGMVLSERVTLGVPHWVKARAQVLIDAVGETVAKGRSKGDAPEIDGTVYVVSRRPLRVGEFATVKIERADAYDLHGTVVGF